MKRIEYTVHAWTDIRDTADSLFNRLNKIKLDNYVQVVYNNSLPKAINDVLAMAMIHGLSQHDEDVSKLIDASLQLEDVGYIGFKN